MKASIKNFIKNIISLAIVLGLVYYLFKNWEFFNKTLDASWHQLLGLAVFILITWMLNSCQILLILSKVGVKVGFWENLLLFIATALANYLPMRLGTLIRMRYLNKVYGMQYIKISSIVGVRTFIFLASTGILGCIGMIGLKVSSEELNLPLLIVFVSILVISFGVYLIPVPRKNKTNNLFLKAWSDFLIGFEVIKSSPTLLWQNIGLVLLQYLMLAMRLFITFNAIQIKLSPWVFLILAPMTTLISFLSLTPGNLGLREWAIGIVSFALGVDFRSGIFAGTLDRAILMAVTFIFGSGSLAYVWFRMENAVSKGKEKVVHS
jgi:uncharacterized membrane protein YbhN (UPF0104 family)